MEYIRLFDGETQGTGTTVSEAFRSDYTNQVESSLRFAGTLDGGVMKLQTLDPSVALTDATDSDWVDTDDTISFPSYSILPFQQLNLRLKATGLGASADFTVDLIKNKK